MRSLNYLLFAQESAYKHLGDNFTEEAPGFNWWQLALAFGVVISALVLAYFINRYFLFFERRSKRSTARLFWDLCQAHELDHHGRHLLKLLAHVHDMQPADLFLMPEKFAVIPDSTVLTPQRRAELPGLRDKIFGTTLFAPDPEEAPAEAT